MSPNDFSALSGIDIHTRKRAIDILITLAEQQFNQKDYAPNPYEIAAVSYALLQGQPKPLQLTEEQNALVSKTTRERDEIYNFSLHENARLMLLRERMEREYAELHESREVDRKHIEKLEAEISQWHKWQKHIEACLWQDGIDIDKYQVEGA